MIHEVLRLERPLISVDLETTTSNVQRARIVELGLVIMRPDGTTKLWRSLVNPQEPIPAGATAVHHITDADVADAPTFAQLAPNLATGFADADFIAYNGKRFDLPVLRNEFQRVGVAWDYTACAVIDPFKLWQHLQPRSLEDALEMFGEGAKIEGGAHNALGDAQASVLALIGQLRYPGKSLPRSVRQLHDLCAPGHIDADGKFVWENGEAVIAFGKHKGTPLKSLDKGFLRWMLKGDRDFSAEAKQIALNALNGQYPVQEGSDATD